MKTNHAGFTLIEILLVLLLIGMIVSTVSIPNFAGDPSKKLDEHRQRFEALFELAVDYSALNNVVMGVKVEPDLYQFLVFNGTQWQPIEQPPLTQQQFEADTKLEIRIDGLAGQEDNLVNSINWQQQSELDDEDEPLIPDILILPSGEISAFELTFHYDDSIDTELSQTLIGQFSLPLEYLQEDDR